MAAEIQRRAQAGEAGAQVAFAAELDRQGRHDEAIDWLARAAQTGHAGALTTLGLRLVSGQNAPFLPSDGARLLADAAAQGGAEAAGRLAVLVGLGFYTQQDWRKALAWLGRSAELGSAEARAQLEVLTGRAPQRSSWIEAAGSVDPGPWLEPVQPSRVVCEAPQMLAFEAFLSPAACDWAIGQARSRLAPARVYDQQDRGGAANSGRSNTVANFTLIDTSLLNLLIQARIAAAIGAPQGAMEAANVLHYDAGEEFRDHFDFLDPAAPSYAAEIARMGQRVGTFLIYLNDDYEGGATDFPKAGVSHRGGHGDGFYFRSCDAAGKPDVRSAHAGRPATSGEKWVFSQFVRDRPDPALARPGRM
jgi:hypothetical protein